MNESQLLRLFFLQSPGSYITPLAEFTLIKMAGLKFAAKRKMDCENGQFKEEPSKAEDGESSPLLPPTDRPNTLHSAHLPAHVRRRLLHDDGGVAVGLVAEQREEVHGAAQDTSGRRKNLHAGLFVGLFVPP